MFWAWERFAKQAPALAACAQKRAEAAAALLSIHARAEPWMVTAMDIDAHGNKAYALTTPGTAFLACLERDAAHRVDDRAAGVRVGRHQYEILMPDEPLRLYYDAEFDTIINPARDGDACVRALHAYMNRAYMEIPNRPRERLDADAVAVETSHRTGAKVSFHGKLRPAYGVAADMTAQRLFWGRVAALIEADAHAGVADACALRVNVYRKLPRGARHVVGDQLFCDMRVYTTYRLMRFLGACKWPRDGAAPAYLVPRGATRADITYEAWRDALVSVALRPAEAPAPPVLDMPAAWHAHVPTYWKSPIARALPNRAAAGSDGARAPVSTAAAAGLQRYRREHWPLPLLVTLCTFGGAVPLADRELAFQLMDGTFVRHVAYADAAQLRALVATGKRAVAAMHIGTAATHGRVPGTAVARCALRELVFDIDASEYDGDARVRTCACAGTKNVCWQCWLHMELAAAVIDDALTVRMGVPRAHVLWVWSGGRGLHVWVNALAVLTLTPAERTSLCQRLLAAAPPDLRLPLTPSTVRLFERVIVPAWERAAARRAFVSRERVAQWAAWLSAALPPSPNDCASDYSQSSAAAAAATIYDPAFAAALRADLALEDVDTDVFFDPRGTARWARVRAAYERTRGARGAAPVQSLYWLIAQYAWPRIDTPVTCKKRGTLRAPFSVHPRTGKLTLPIRPPYESLLEAPNGGKDDADDAAAWHRVTRVHVTDFALPPSDHSAGAEARAVVAAAQARFVAWLQFYAGT